MWWILLACRDQAPADSAPLETVSVLASELYGDGFAAWTLPGQAPGARLSLAQAHPEVCAGEGDLCLNYHALPHPEAPGGAQVLYTFTPMNTLDGDDLGRDDRHGWIAAAGWPDLSPRWAVRALDFSGVSGGEAQCTWDPADPCAPAAGLPDREHHRCFLYQPHELAVVEDDGAQVHLWVTDSRNNRLLRLAITPGQSCAQVEEVLDAQAAGWGELHAPNALQRWVEGGVEHLLVGLKDSFASAGGGEGQGALTLWTRTTGAPSFTRAWRHPPEGAWLNSPHGLTRAEGPSGEPWVLYAHSAGLGPAWNLGPGGTLGVLELTGAAPTHLADLTVPAGLSYPRDVLPLGPGEVLLVDSGCKGGLVCERASGVWWLSLPELGPSGGTGAYGELSPQELAPRGGPWLEDAARLYSLEAL